MNIREAISSVKQSIANAWANPIHRAGLIFIAAVGVAIAIGIVVKLVK